MLDLRCKKHWPNPLIEINSILTCVLCGPVITEEESRPTKKERKQRISGDFSDITCSLCRKIKKRKKVGGYNYVDDAGNKWLRRRCPDCKPAMIYKQNIKRPRTLEERRCLTCQTLFRPKNAKHVYCTLNCTVRPSKVQNNEPKASPKIETPASPKKTIKSYCLSCKKKLLSIQPRKYCDKTCANKYNYKNNVGFKEQLKELKMQLKSSTSYKKWRQYKKLHGDKITSKARIAGTTWKDLDVFFNNCPPNHRIELVIPLVDQNICGLFVPWNFLYKKIS